MLSVAALGSVMSSTGVVAIFVPVALAVAKRLEVPARQLLMPLSFAGLTSGMLTLIATAPNLVVNAELVRQGLDGFGFFTPTPIGLVVLALGIGYMLFTRRWLGGAASAGTTAARRTMADLLTAYDLAESGRRFQVRASSPLDGHTLAELDLRNRYGLTVLAIQRGPAWQRILLAAGPDTRLASGDLVTVKLSGSAEPGRPLDELGVDEVEFTPDSFARQSRQIGMAELMVPPASPAAGRMLADLDLPASHGLTVLGLRHHGRTISGPLARRRAEPGDTLLVVGAWDAIARQQKRAADFVVLDLPAEVEETTPAGNRAGLALFSLLAMVVLMVTGVVPNVIAALIACLLMGAFGCIDMASAYRAVHWPTLLVIVGMLPFAQALKTTGGTELAANGLLALVGGAGPTVVLGAIFLVTSLIGMFVSNTATAVLMAPVAIATAVQLGVSPYPFALTVAIAASAAFMTPVSSPVNTLIVEPGRYRFVDFVKIGTPFTIIVMLVTATLVPVLLPL